MVLANESYGVGGEGRDWRCWDMGWRTQLLEAAAVYETLH